MSKNLMSDLRILAFFLVVIMQGGCSPAETTDQEVRSIKSHMAEMEGYSNVLFRDIDDPKYKDEVLAHLKKLRAGLRASMKQIPESVSSGNIAVSQRNELVEDYQARVRVADDMIGKMITKVEKGEFSEAKHLLLELDQIRRDCHSEYGE